MMLVRRCEMLPVECIVRGYLAGSGWKEYQARRHGVRRAPAGRAGRGRPAAGADLHAVHEGGRRHPRREHHLRRRGRARRRRAGRGGSGPCRSTSTAGPPPTPSAAGSSLADTKFELGLSRRAARAGRRGAHPGLVALLAGRRAGSPGARPRRSTSSRCATSWRRRGWDKRRHRRRSRRPRSPPPGPATSRRYERLSGRSFADWPGGADATSISRLYRSSDDLQRRNGTGDVTMAADDVLRARRGPPPRRASPIRRAPPSSGPCRRSASTASRERHGSARPSASPSTPPTRPRPRAEVERAVPPVPHQPGHRGRRRRPMRGEPA